MKFETTRFGQLEVPDDDVFTLKDGLIGFSDFTRVVVLQHDPESPFKWLQSVDEPGLAFAVIDPVMFVPEYPLDELKKALSDKDRVPSDVGVAAIATVPPAPNPITVNLLAPVVLDSERRVGAQVILNGTEYTTRHLLVNSDEEEEEAAEAAAAE